MEGDIMDYQKICYIDLISDELVEQHDIEYQKQSIKRMESDVEESDENYCSKQDELFSKIMALLPQEGKDMFMTYCDNINENTADRDRFFYQSGFKDGIRLMKELLEY